jgi:hypothetical protein
VDEIMDMLRKMSGLLERFGPRSWAEALRQCADDFPSDPTTTAATVRRMYGGMGSLNDIVLYDSDGKALYEENNTFDALRAKLYDACR